MKTLKKSPNIAVLFGLLAIATSVILVVEAPKELDYIFAVLWLVTGLLGFYSIFRK